MRVAARIEATEVGIEYAVVISDEDEDGPVDIELWCRTAVQHCHQLRERTMTSDQDRVQLELMEPNAE